MHQLLFTMPSPSSSSKPHKFSSSSSSNPNPNSISSSSSIPCKHSPSATLDILILILVLFSGIFLLTSYFSYIFRSLSILLSHSSFQLSIHVPPVPYICGFLALFLLSIILVDFCCGPRSRKCDKPGCKGLKKAMEFDLQLQTEDCVKSSAAKEFDKLPWKGGTEGNPDYECLRAELRKMAPPNGRAVLLFRARCGCPIAKLEGWGPKKGRRHKKALANVAVNGGDHR
ncbi:uncharacterized protein At5g19025 [Manihot esculenta]|uniref:Ribosomal protein L34e superfamily protein n=1 Tax=Manihot esculenta TaxID=3983 RepID=A0A2C9UC26_MANES|nr:uncharacterized protein At5g19025 [Manihot esculenta]OAY27865.1 hypothetical protein MANES_15G022200v8 [Manihot esculenta]